MSKRRNHNSLLRRASELLTTAGLILLGLNLLLAFLPAAVLAVVGTITVDISPTSGDETTVFTASGTWEPAGAQCWTPGGGGTFHYRVEVFDDTNFNNTLDAGEPILGTVNPAACNGDYTSPVSNDDRPLGGPWAAAGQSPVEFTLGPGTHQICAVLRHVNQAGQDIGSTTVCFGTTIIIEPVPGSITVQKDVVPDDSGASSWLITISGPTPNSTTLSDGGSATYDSDPGSYTISEPNDPNYTESVSCNTGESGTTSVTFDLAEGESVTCTFTNTLIPPPGPGTITVMKDVVPDDSSLWDISISGPDSFSETANDLGDGGSFTWSELDSGSYTLSEPDDPNYTESVSCDTGDSGDNSVTVELDAEESIICTFTNTANPGSITVEKDVVDSDGGPAVDPTEFTAFLNGGDAQPFSEVLDAVYSELTPGLYTITEDLPSGYTLFGTVGDEDGGTAGIQVNLGPGEVVTVQFINAQPVPPPPLCGMLSVLLTDDGPATLPDTLIAFTAEAFTNENVVGPLLFEFDFNGDTIVDSVESGGPVEAISWDYGNGAASYMAMVTVTDTGFEGEGECAVSDLDPVTINAPAPTPTPPPPGPTPTSEVLGIVLPVTGFGPPPMDAGSLGLSLRLVASALMTLSGLALRRLSR